MILSHVIKTIQNAPSRRIFSEHKQSVLLVSTNLSALISSWHHQDEP